MSLSRNSLVFDPCGDVFIVLKRSEDRTNLEDASSVKVALVDDAPANNALADDAPVDDAPADDAPVDDAPADDAPVDDAPADDAPVDDAPANDAPADDAPADDAPANGAPETRTDKPSAEIIIQEVVCQVSSRHLSLASKVFGHNFFGKSLEHDSSTDRNLVTIPLLEDNFHAMVMLLNIVHGLTRSVPRQVGMDSLLQAAILINKYEFHEVAEIYTDMWLDCLRPKMPTRLHQDLASWIYICWVLEKPVDLNTLTKIAIRETNYGLVDPDGVIPIPYWINGRITPTECGENCLTSLR